MRSSVMSLRDWTRLFSCWQSGQSGSGITTWRHLLDSGAVRGFGYNYPLLPSSLSSGLLHTFLLLLNYLKIKRLTLCVFLLLFGSRFWAQTLVCATRGLEARIWRRRAHDSQSSSFLSFHTANISRNQNDMTDDDLGTSVSEMKYKYLTAVLFSWLLQYRRLVFLPDLQIQQ